MVFLKMDGSIGWGNNVLFYEILHNFLDKQGKEIQEQDIKIMTRIAEFYSELYDSDEAVTIHTDLEEVPPIMAWEVKDALRKMKNGKEAGKDQVNRTTHP